MAETPQKEMGFFDHLGELRWRMVKCFIAMLIFAIIIFIYETELVEAIFIGMSKPDFITYDFLCRLSQAMGMEESLCASEIKLQLIETKMGGQFTTSIYLAVIGGIVIAFPYIFYQLWSFVKPGLKKNEIKGTSGIVFYASLLFALGIAFGYWIVSPLCVQFFGTYSISEDIVKTPIFSEYISLIATTTFWTGILFQLPMVIYILSRLGLIGPEFLRTYRKHAVVVVLILAAIITPPDFISQIIVAVPILLLYEIGIFVSASVAKKSAV
ncbi:MAG: twin-arginine translocase subunit TatC [Bacteroidota bacterium]